MTTDNPIIVGQPPKCDYWMSASLRGRLLMKVRLGSECDVNGLCDFLNVLLPSSRVLDINIHETEPMEATDGHGGS